MKKSLLAAACSLGVLLAFEKASVAEDLSPIVVTPNRYPKTIEEIGSSITVLDEEEIEIKQQDFVLDLLRRVPGLSVQQSGGSGRVASVFIRGAESDQTLVLIDGIRANDNGTGQFDFSGLKAENIERIEVLKGPQSVLYGSEAIGGVINIITKEAEDGAGASLSAEGGSFGTQEYRVSGNYATGAFYTSTTASYFRTDGISAAADNPENDSYDNLTFTTKTGTRFLGDGKAEVTARYTTGTTEVDVFEFGVGQTDDPNFEQDSDLYSQSLVVTKSITENIIPRLEVGFTNQSISGIDPDTTFNNFDIKNRTQSYVGTVDFLFPWDGVLTAGYSFEHRATENVGNFDERRDVNSGFLQKQLSFDEAVFLTAGVRYDHDSVFGDQVTYRTTAAWLLEEWGTRFHGSFGTGFKAPAFNELFFPNFGNPDLDAETSLGYDIGIEQELFNGAASLDVTFFQNKIDDLITFDSETFLAANIEEADIFGFENSLRVDLLEWMWVISSYTYTDSENKTTGGILPRRPRHRGTVDLFVNVSEELTSSVSFLLVNSQRDSDGSRVDNYERVDLALAYQVHEHIKPYLRIDNVFDADYEEIPGFGVAGFSVFAGVEASL